MNSLSPAAAVQRITNYAAGRVSTHMLIAFQQRLCRYVPELATFRVGAMNVDEV